MQDLAPPFHPVARNSWPASPIMDMRSRSGKSHEGRRCCKQILRLPRRTRPAACDRPRVAAAAAHQPRCRKINGAFPRPPQPDSSPGQSPPRTVETGLPTARNCKRRHRQHGPRSSAIHAETAAAKPRLRHRRRRHGGGEADAQAARRDQLAQHIVVGQVIHQRRQPADRRPSVSRCSAMVAPRQSSRRSLRDSSAPGRKP